MIVWKNKSFRFLIFIAGIFLLWYLGRFTGIDIKAITGSLKKFPLFISGPVFVLIYCIVTFFFWFSKDAFRIASALVFGAYWSTLLVWIAECLNALILFNAARYLGKGFVERSIGGRRGGLYDLISRMNFLWLLIFRATPLLPFRFFDLGCGLTRMPFGRYFTAVVIGSPLRIFWVQFILAGAGEGALSDPSALSRYLAANRVLFVLSLVYIALAAVVVFKIRDKKWR